MASGGGGGGGANSVDRSIGNTYFPGAKQTFVPSLATSGINITPGTLPTNPAAGDISLDSGDANKLKVYDGGQWNTLVTSSNYVATFTAQTQVTVNGTTHRLGTANLNTECYDGASPSAQVEPDKIVVDPVTFNVNIYFASAQTGRCMITGSGGVTSAGSSGAGMASQLGRFGVGSDESHGADRRLKLLDRNPLQYKVRQHRIFHNQQQYDHSFFRERDPVPVRGCFRRIGRRPQSDIELLGRMWRSRQCNRLSTRLDSTLHMDCHKRSVGYQRRQRQAGIPEHAEFGKRHGHRVAGHGYANAGGCGFSLGADVPDGGDGSGFCDYRTRVVCRFGIHRAWRIGRRLCSAGVACGLGERIDRDHAD